MLEAFKVDVAKDWPIFYHTCYINSKQYTKRGRQVVSTLKSRRSRQRAECHVCDLFSGKQGRHPKMDPGANTRQHEKQSGATAEYGVGGFALKLLSGNLLLKKERRLIKDIIIIILTRIVSVRHGRDSE